MGCPASIRFGEAIADIENSYAGVCATLASDEKIRADLLFGTDGFRSTTRQKIFAPDDICLAPLGYYFAVYGVGAPRNFDSDFLSYAEPGHLAEYYTLHDGRLVAMHVWRDNRAGLEKTEDRFELLAEVSRNSHPEVRALLEDAQRNGASPLIDSLTMIDLPRWSKGRVLLLGEAAHCLT